MRYNVVHRPRQPRDPRRQLGDGDHARDAGGAIARGPADRHREARADEPLEGYTFEGYRNSDGSVGTRNILAITETVQCVSGVVDFAVRRIKAELLPKYPNVDDVVGLEHGYGCGVAIDAPDAKVPIRTLRNITLNPNFGNEVMVVSLGCEKLQPQRMFPPGSIRSST
jgi:galactarate dehydratase